MRVAYTKIGRTQGYHPSRWGQAGGDWEAPLLLNRLARFYPEIEWVIVGHNDGADPQKIGLPSNVVQPLDENMRGEIRRRERVINVSGTPPVENSQTYIRYMREVWDPVLNTCDNIVIWIGQNDTINQPIPKIPRFGEGLGSSRMIYIRNVSYVFNWLNDWQDRDPLRNQPVWLCSDIWNTLKARDLKWPQLHPVVCQYNFQKTQNAYRWGDPRMPEEFGLEEVARVHPEYPGCWSWDLSYVYGGLELGSCVPSSIEFNDSWEDRGRFGVMINQSRAASGRDQVLAQYVRPLWPDWVVGSWDEDRAPDIKPYPWHAVPELLQTVRSSLAVPIKLGNSWATPKAWELFSAGTVAFMHPQYDTQGHIIPTLEQVSELERLEGESTLTHLARWLRVDSPGQLRRRVDHLNSNREDWEWIVRAQRALYNATREEQTCLRMIGSQLGIQDAMTRVA